jgi:hypothetical protein
VLRDTSYNDFSEYNKTVHTVWETSLSYIKQADLGEEAIALLAFLSHFDNACIQDELFASIAKDARHHPRSCGIHRTSFPVWLQEVTETVNGTWDDFKYWNLFRLLIRYGIVQEIVGIGGWPGLTMHGLVRWRVEQLRHEHQLWDVAVYILSSSMNQALLTGSTFLLCGKRHLPMAEDMRQDNWFVRSEMIYDACVRIANTSKYLGRYDDAILLFEECAKYSTTPDVSPHVFWYVHYNLTLLRYEFEEQGKEEQEATLCQLIKQQIEERGMNEDILTKLLLLGHTSHRVGRWKHAKSVYLEALDGLYKSRHPHTATSLRIQMSLANIYFYYEHQCTHAMRLLDKIIEWGTVLESGKAAGVKPSLEAEHLEQTDLSDMELGSNHSEEKNWAGARCRSKTAGPKAICMDGSGLHGHY